MSNRMLIHEVWLDPGEDGQMLPSLCLAGPMGDDHRHLLNPRAILRCRIEGASHFDVMTKYWQLNEWGEYKTSFKEDHDPYPESWITLQQTFLAKQAAKKP